MRITLVCNKVFNSVANAFSSRYARSGMTRTTGCSQHRTVELIDTRIYTKCTYLPVFCELNHYSNHLHQRH